MDTSPAAPTAGGPPTAAPFAPGSSLRLAAAVVVSVLAVEAALSMLGQTRPNFAGRRDSTATTSTSAAASGQLYEALSAGATSPRGTPGRGVAANRAIESAAGAQQVTGAARDTDEGAYWLKHYLAATLGEDRTVRALTQLGTTYAEPARGAPDFARARVVWELSSAFGDPVAMCFVGRLHEAGLGVVADRGQALLWYERSRASGGCPQLDEAIARVK